MNKSTLKRLISIFGAGVIISASLMATGLVGVKSYADGYVIEAGTNEDELGEEAGTVAIGVNGDGPTVVEPDIPVDADENAEVVVQSNPAPGFKTDGISVTKMDNPDSPQVNVTKVNDNRWFFTMPNCGVYVKVFFSKIKVEADDNGTKVEEEPVITLADRFPSRIPTEKATLKQSGTNQNMNIAKGNLYMEDAVKLLSYVDGIIPSGKKAEILGCYAVNISKDLKNEADKRTVTLSWDNLSKEELEGVTGKINAIIWTEEDGFCEVEGVLNEDGTGYLFDIPMRKITNIAIYKVVD